MTTRAGRMQAAVSFIASNPGATAAAVTAHLIGGEEVKPSAYKTAATVVDRIIRDRLVRQDALRRLHPWDAKRKAFAEALERAAFAAPDARRYASTIALAAAAWREAGDENRARVLEGLQREA